MSLRSRSPAETEAIGWQIGTVFPAGGVAALHGTIGSGKTVLAQGILGAVTGLETFPSPTYVICNGYPGPTYHLDLYRISQEELQWLDWQEYVGSDARTVVEWAERAQDLLPAGRLDAFLVGSGDERRIDLAADAEPGLTWLSELTRRGLAGEVR